MAEGDDEIILLCDYKQMKIGESYNLKNATKEDVVALLVRISNSIEPYAYQFSGIDTKKIDSMINVGKGLAAVCAFLKSFKKDSLLSAVSESKAKVEDKSKMLPIAESYLLNQLLARAGVAFKPQSLTSLRPNPEKPLNQVVFIGKYKDWVAIKKLSVDSKTEDWEVAGILASINHTVLNKAFAFTGSDDKPLSGRKSFSNLASALEKIDEKNPYLICKTCEAFGYIPYATPEILMDAYPDLKPVKLRGRKPKG